MFWGFFIAAIRVCDVFAGRALGVSARFWAFLLPKTGRSCMNLTNPPSKSQKLLSGLSPFSDARAFAAQKQSENKRFWAFYCVGCAAEDCGGERDF